MSQNLETTTTIIQQSVAKLLSSRQNATTATFSTVAHSAISSSTEVIAADNTRIGAVLYNNTNGDVYLKYGGGTVSASSFSVKLVTGAYLEVPYRFEGAITAITGAGSGNLLITTLT